jgi:hypothetical protein
MKTAILGVLLLLAIVSFVSGAPAENGKSRYGQFQKMFCRPLFPLDTSSYNGLGE